MSEWIEAVTDRTQSDVDNDTSKGNYNAEDLNRVETNCVYLVTKLNDFGYAVNIVSHGVWTRNDKPNKSDMRRILDNINKIVKVYYTLPDTPPLPSTYDNLTFTGANHIEKVMSDVNRLLNMMNEQFKFVGSFRVNEEILPEKPYAVGRTFAELDIIGLTFDILDELEVDWFLFEYGSLEYKGSFAEGDKKYNTFDALDLDDITWDDLEK